MEREKRLYIYIADRAEFDKLIEEAAKLLADKHELSQHKGQEPSVSKVLIAALRELVKESKKD